jgi:hypothetical protein
MRTRIKSKHEGKRQKHGDDVHKFQVAQDGFGAGLLWEQ